MALGKAGLIVVEKRSRAGKVRGEKHVKLTELGKENLDFIERYNNYFSRIPPDEKIAIKLDEIIENLRKYDAKIRAHYIGELRNLCRTNSNAARHPGLGVFFKDYLEKKEHHTGIDDCLNVSLKSMLEHEDSKKYLDEILLPIIMQQFSNKNVDIDIRMTRVAFLWELYDSDYKKRDILKLLIDLMEDECISCPDLCSSIKSYIRNVTRDELIGELLDMGINIDTINKLID
jgi:hypothetical protein